MSEASEQPRDGSMIRFIRSAISKETQQSSDAELLEKFVSQHDNAAFELLVDHHSAAILRACRSVLKDHHAAEDATQAAFLALARKAPTIRNRESVVGWLYRTAYRISSRTARKITRDKAAELTDDPLDTDSLADPNDTESIIHQEIARLPEKYRLPLLYCCFEGLSFQDAAKHLGWPIGTICTRVARGKDVLRRRLEQRGVAVPTAGIAAVLTIAACR